MKPRIISLQQLVNQTPADIDRAIAGARVGSRHRPSRIKTMKITPETDDSWNTETPPAPEITKKALRKARKKFAAFAPPPPFYGGEPMSPKAKADRAEALKRHKEFWGLD